MRVVLRAITLTVLSDDFHNRRCFLPFVIHIIYIIFVTLYSVTTLIVFRIKLVKCRRNIIVGSFNAYNMILLGVFWYTRFEFISVVSFFEPRKIK